MSKKGGLNRARASLAVALGASSLLALIEVTPAAAADFEWSRAVTAVTVNGDFAPLAADDSGVYFASPGSSPTSSDILVKFLPGGSSDWSRTPAITGGSATINGAAADESGVYISGTLTGHWPGQADAPDGAAYLAHYSSTGDFLWARQFALPSTDSGFVWADTPALAPGAVYFAGGFINGNGMIARVDRDGAFRWRHDAPFDGEFGSATADADGLVVTDTAGDLHAYDPTGLERWSTTVLNTWDIVAAPGGGTVLLGQRAASDGIPDSIVARKVSTNGSVGAVHTVFSRRGAVPTGIATASGHIYAAWYSDGARSASPQVGWGELTASLGTAWTRSHDSNVFASAFAASSRGGYIVSSQVLAALRLDWSAPIASWNNYMFRPGMLPDDYLGGNGTWKGHDDASGIDYFQVQQRENGGTWTDVDLADDSMKSALIAEKPGAAYSFRVRAVDMAGNVGKWSASAVAYALSWIQDNSKQISYDANWSSVQEPDANGGFVMSAAKQGSTANFQFSGNGFGFVSIIGPDRGKVAVFVDGNKITTLDLYAKAQAEQYVSFARSWANNGAHTVKLVVQGTATRPRVDIDGFEVMAKQ